MSPTPALDPTWTCPNCVAIATSSFCPSCGERRIANGGHEASRIRSRERHAPWFGRLLASLRALASPPGRLTAAWCRGRRVRYLAPLSFFLLTNVAFFIAQSASGLGVLSWPLRAHLKQSWFGPLSSQLLALYRPGTSVAGSAQEQVFDALESVHAKSLVILMVPAFALALRFVLAGRRVSFSECMSFALHVYTFALIWLCALFPAAAIGLRLFVLAGGRVTPEGIDLVVSLLETGVIAWYIAVALVTVWHLPRWRSLGATVLLVSVMSLLLRPYHFVVFAVTLFST